MHTICFNPDASLTCRPPLSLKFNHPCYLFDEMLERNPLLISSQKCCCSCCCCYYGANSSMCNNRVATINPSFLCKGLRQSTLIQLSLCKRLIFHGSSKQVYHNTSGVSSFTDLDKDYYHKKLSSFNERSKHRQRGFGHTRKKQFLSNVSDDYTADVEVMLSLLTDEVGLECIDVRDRKKIDKKHSEEKKKLCSGVAKRELKCNKVVKVTSTKVDDLRKEVSNKHKSNSERRDHEGSIDKQQECVKEQEKISEQKDDVKGYYGESIGASQDWRKKSEKKLNEEFNQPQSNVYMNMDKQNHEVDRVGHQSGSRMKYKRFEEMSDKDKSVIESTSVSQKQYVDTEKKIMISEVRKPQKTGTEYDHSSLETELVEETMSGPKGPSDEMWHVTDTSTQEPSETDAPDNISYSSEIGDVSKASSRSMWMILGDVVRFRWASPHSHTPKSCGGMGSSCLSVSSEAWFSSHDSNDDNLKKRSRKGLESPLSLSNNEGPFRTTSLPIIEELSIPLPAIRMRRSPVDESVGPSHVSGSDSRIGELKRRKLVDKFDEWEEVYTLEEKQRKEDEMFMREALLEAKKAAGVWEVPVGAVLVKGGKIIARGYNLVEELRDSTAHAEMICIRQASTELSSWRLLDTTLYVTLEPCPMCAGAILQARIGTVVWGAPNKLLGADGSWIRLFSDGDEGKDSMPTDKPPAPVHPFHTNMAVRRGVLAAECAGVMQDFFRLRRNKKKEPPIPPSSITVPHYQHSNFFSKMQHAFKIIFCL